MRNPLTDDDLSRFGQITPEEARQWREAVEVDHAIQSVQLPEPRSTVAPQPVERLKRTAPKRLPL